MRIFTLTLNPAYDVHVHARHFAPFHENIATVLSREAGGKGVNISRALQSAKVANTAVVVTGSDNAEPYRQMLAQAGLSVMEIELPGSIRENLTLHCDNGPETRISFTGFAAGDSILDEIFTQIRPDADTILTMTGRIAQGMTMERVKEFLKKAAACGAKIVVDSRSFGLSDLAEVKPWLIKPNQEEISAFFGCAVESIRDAAEKARELAARGIANVMISLGQQGALLVAEGTVLHAMPPRIQAVSTVGAGDSTIAGFLAAAINNQPPEECLRLAVAFGTAACLTEGTQPPQSKAVEQLKNNIRITKL